MVYTSNADVLYRRKKNTYRGAATRGVGYGYSKSGIADLLKAFTGNGRRMKLFPKKKSATQTRQKTKNGFVGSEGGNSISKCNFGTKPLFLPKALLQVTAPQHRVSNSASKAVTTPGVQGFYEIGWLTAPIVAAMSASLTDRLFIQKIDGEVNLVNTSATNSTLMIYDIIAKRDISTVSKNSSPGVAWGYGIDNEGGTNSDYSVIGSTPMESEMFRNFYRIVQKTPVSLAPGEMHRHLTTYRPNQAVSDTVGESVAYGIQGLSCWTLIVHYGMPAHDSTTETSVTIDPSDLDIVHSMSVDWRQIQKNDTAWTKSNNLATTFAVGEEFVNKAQGAVQNVGGLDFTDLHA